MSLTMLALALVAACNRDPAVADAPTPNAVSDAVAADPLAAPSDVKAPPADAQKSASGLAWKVLTPGSGATKPGPEDQVTVHYTGWTTDGKIFDSSLKRGEPATFPLNGVISGWTEGLQLMVEGEKRRFWIPVDLAYQGRPGKPAGMLVFDVELISIKAAPKPIPAPDDVAAAPGDATITKSGLAYKTLTPGDGPKPSATDKVKVHYTGWTTDGEMFDSSVVRGEPATFPLNKVIPGWTEGVQLISLGGTTRIWVPEELAYKGKPGRPKGMLVFDVQLLEIIAPPKPPKDLKAPPANAERTASGIASVVITPGGGGPKPGPTSVVKVHYSGWTTDGEIFDSSVERGQPAKFPLNQVIPGWTEGVQLMSVGEKRIFWIPEELAYKGKPGAPQGMLIFEVELLGIVSP
jgi:FKBP-type peptidyl-prolyl cis-trans isomerase